MITIKPVFNRSKKLNKSGKGNIDMRIIFDRKATYFNTKIKIIPEQWDKKNNRVKKTNPNWFEYNSRIDELLRLTEKYNSEIIKTNSFINILEYKKILSGNANEDVNFLFVFLDNESEQRQNLSTATIRNYKSKVIVLKEFVKNDIHLSKINFEFIQLYENFLIGKGYSVNTRHNHHKWLKTYLNVAIKKDIIVSNPYKNFKIIKEQTEREYLTLEEIKLIEKIELESGFENYQLVIDKFLFSCYTGLRISDLQSITNSCFVVENEKVYLSFRMQKTIKLIRNMPLHLLFNGKAIDIYNKYKSKNLDQTLFPKQAEQKINDKLKDVANLAEINKNLTFHVARHSFGSALARVYNDVLLIKELMGHSKLETSMIYIHMNPEIIEEKLSKKKFPS